MEKIAHHELFLLLNHFVFNGRLLQIRQNAFIYTLRKGYIERTGSGYFTCILSPALEKLCKHGTLMNICGFVFNYYIVIEV